jgi:transcriptional regulator with XRE-family HTH domain
MEARNKPFHKRLRGLREDLHRTQREGALQLGIDPAKYNKWENGVNRPDYETLCKIADHYNVSTDFLLGRTDVESPKMDIGSLCKTLGLSEEIVETLKLYHSAEGNDYLKIINKLLLWMGEEK